MKQSDLLKLVSYETGVKYESCRKVLRKITKYLAVALDNEDEFRIGMGTFYIKRRGPKPVQNFKTGGRYMLPETYKVTFTPSNYIKGVLKRKDSNLHSFVSEDIDEDGTED